MEGPVLVAIVVAVAVAEQKEAEQKEAEVARFQGFGLGGPRGRIWLGFR